MYIHNWCHSSISGILYIHRHRLQCTAIYGAFPLLLSPLASSPFLPLCTPFYLLGTLLAVTGFVHLGLRLLVNWSPLPHPSPKPSPLQIPRTPTAQRLTKTTSGIIRLLPSRTVWPHNNCLTNISEAATFDKNKSTNSANVWPHNNCLTVWE